MRELMLEDAQAGLADGSAQIPAAGAWQDEAGIWLDASTGGEEAYAATAPDRATLAGLAPHAFGPAAPDPVADLALKDLRITPEWSALEG